MLVRQRAGPGCAEARVRTLHLYLLRQIVATLLMASAVFTFVLLLGNVLREILPLIITQKATFGLVAQAFGLLIPFVAVFALPMGLLTATLLVFGRFSADQELTAARASGISLLVLTTPILILSLLLCGVSAWVNLEIAPRSRVAYNALRFNLRAALVNAQLPAGRYIDFPGNPAVTLYVGKNRKGELQDVLLCQVRNETNVESWVTAPRGRLIADPTNQVLLLKLFDAKVVMVNHDTPGAPIMGDVDRTLDLKPSQTAMKQPGIGDMTFNELRTEFKRLEKRLSQPLSLPQENAASAEDRKRDLRKQLGDLTEPIRIQIHRRVAFSFACFGFTLIGIPLGHPNAPA